MISEVTNGVHAWWAPALAFAAGIVSFASPCVLPLVPGYVSFLTGQEPGAKARRTFVPIVLFILGFSVIFTVLFGLGASAISHAIRSSAGQRVAGAFVVAFGIFMVLYAFRARIPLLYREGRPLLERVPPGPASAFPLGMAFAVGWTPCIGPVLGAIIGLASAQGTTGRAVLLLGFYSLGLGVPFLLLGLGIRRLLFAARFFSRNYHWFAGAAGGLLVVIGALLLTGRWTPLVAPVFRFANRLSLPL